jgi:hypothetical protein
MIKVDLDRLKDPRYRKCLAIIKWRKIVRDNGNDYDFHYNNFYSEFEKLEARCSYCQYCTNCESCELHCEGLHNDWSFCNTKEKAQAVLDLIKKVEVPKNENRA